MEQLKDRKSEPTPSSPPPSRREPAAWLWGYIVKIGRQRANRESGK